MKTPNLSHSPHLCSIWTVDLAYLLRRFGLEVEFTTITIGANPEYAKESFYREHMAEDGSRVERLFQVFIDAMHPSKHDTIVPGARVVLRRASGSFLLA